MTNIKANQLYDEFCEEYEKIADIDSYLTEFGHFSLSSYRKNSNKKLYTVKIIRNPNKNYSFQPILEVLNDLEIFQEMKENRIFLLPIELRFKCIDPETRESVLYIVQKDYRLFKLLRYRIKTKSLSELRMLTILRGLAKLYFNLILFPIAKTLSQIKFLNPLNTNSIFVYNENKEKKNKLECERIRVDLLDFSKKKQDSSYSKEKKDSEKLHLFEFCSIILELLFNVSLTCSEETSENPIKMEEILKTRKMSIPMRSLFLKIVDEELKSPFLTWKDIISNPIMNQDLSTPIDLVKWKITIKDRKKINLIKVYKYHTLKELSENYESSENCFPEEEVFAIKLKKILKVY